MLDPHVVVALSLTSPACRQSIVNWQRERSRTWSDNGPPEKELAPSESLARLRDALSPRVAPSLAEWETLHARAGQAIARASAKGISPIAWGAPGYPPLLAQIPDPPLVIWARGQMTALLGPAVAIVGSRAASPYATAVAAKLATELARKGVVVVSGLARGVDSAAHRGALTEGRTVAVFGAGVDRVYPAEHQDLAEAVMNAGAVLSELPPGTPPRAEHFPMRNRLISGLSLAVVVVEACERSGSLITARYGLEQGRDVMAVPANVLSERNRGGHRLIRDGAALVETADDIIDELRLPTTSRIERAELEGRTESSVSPEATSIRASMAAGETYDLDELVTSTRMPASTVLACLLDLELSGIVARVGNGRFVRLHTKMVTWG